MRAFPHRYNPWANDANTLALYRRRCRGEAEEMTCAAQAAELLRARVQPGETLLDAGCGGGYYLHSLRSREVPVEYHGLDYTPEMIELAQAELPDADFELGAIEDLAVHYDNVLCFNVLTNSPHYALPLERLLHAARRRIVLRESLGDELIVRYTPDPYLDDGARHIRVYHNQYPIDEVTQFMQEHGFTVTRVVDRRSNDGVEMVVDIPHRWRILVGERA
ncbi:MAG: class I SAM-dependent methyltransferase [Kofleriaceae bacterium]